MGAGAVVEGGRTAEWKALEEGWRVFEKDLSKLQVTLSASDWRPEERHVRELTCVRFASAAIYRDQRHRVPEDPQEVGQEKQE